MITELLEKLEHSNQPVAQVIQKNECSKVVAIAFKKGMVLKEHTTDTPAQLWVIKGSVTYNENAIERQLPLYAVQNIPPAVLHWVVANEDSVCLLFK